MKIRLNENEELVKRVQEGLKRKNGYCPCRKEIKEEIENSKTDIIVNKEPEFKIIMGEEIKSKKITEIKDIIGEENNVTVEAYIFGIEEFVSNKSNFKILTLKISDKTDSILAKIFKKKIGN
mgnify:CR=1 FL=1